MSRMRGVPDEVRKGELPRVYPPLVWVHASADGRTWVKRWPRGGRSFYDVFDAEGVYLGVVVVPALFEDEPAPVFTTGAVYGVVRDADTGVQQVVKLTFKEPGVEPNAPVRSRSLTDRE